MNLACLSQKKPQTLWCRIAISFNSQDPEKRMATCDLKVRHIRFAFTRLVWISSDSFNLNPGYTHPQQPLAVVPSKLDGSQAHVQATLILPNHARPKERAWAKTLFRLQASARFVTSLRLHPEYGLDT